jgi:hypothetical protein
MKQQKEFILQKAICQWLSIQHPKVLFLSDTIASVKLTIPQQARNKSIQKNGFKTPDLIIFKPNKKYHGLFLELKTESPFKLNGEIKASQNDHLKNQFQTLKDLYDLGYCSMFCWSFEEAKGIINDYLNDI